ncbi:MAG: hypothetical protein ACW98Y_21080, partial [Candidatus Thorarchaeota archaeon]
MSICFYLPGAALQGEEIPSHIIWDDSQIERIQISFQHPLKFKEVFNAKIQEINERYVVISEIELSGYVGLVFESFKASHLDISVEVNYSLLQSNGEAIEEKREICLFRPELEVIEIPTRITVNTITGAVDNPIRIKNIGKGTLILNAKSTRGSQLAIQTPLEHTELLSRINSELTEEMDRLGKEFPQFKPLLDKLINFETQGFLDLLDSNRDNYQGVIREFSIALTTNSEFRREFVGAYTKIMIKNIEAFELIRRFVRFYESL